MNSLPNLLLNRVKKSVKSIIVLTAKLISILVPFKRQRCDSTTLRCEYDFRSRHYRNAWLGKDSAPCCNHHLYELLGELDSVLRKSGVPYFIFYGTLLGAVRHHGGFVPWDTDVDICVLECDKAACLAALQTLQTKRPIVEVNAQWLMVEYSEVNKLHADVYFMTVDAELMYLKGYEGITYPIEGVFPLQDTLVYDLSVLAPKDLTLIKEKYGVDYMTVAYRQYALIQRKTGSFQPAKLE